MSSKMVGPLSIALRMYYEVVRLFSQSPSSLHCHVSRVVLMNVSNWTSTRQFQNRRNRYGIRNPDRFEYRYIFRTQSFNRIAEVIPNFLRVIRYYIRVISRMYPLWRFTFKNSRYSREVSRKSFRVFLFLCTGTNFSD